MSFLFPSIRYAFDLKILYNGTLTIDKLFDLFDFNEIEVTEEHAESKPINANLLIGVIVENMSWYPCKADINRDIIGDGDITCIEKSDFGFLSLDPTTFKCEIIDGNDLLKYIKSSIIFKKNTIGENDSVSITLTKI